MAELLSIERWPITKRLPVGMLWKHKSTASSNQQSYMCSVTASTTCSNQHSKVYNEKVTGALIMSTATKRWEKPGKSMLQICPFQVLSAIKLQQTTAVAAWESVCYCSSASSDRERESRQTEPSWPNLPNTGSQFGQPVARVVRAPVQARIRRLRGFWQLDGRWYCLTSLK